MNKPIIFLGDAHLSDHQIKTRVDDSSETGLEKLAWVIDFAGKCGADIIQTGDFISSMLFSTKFRFRVKMLLKNAKQKGVSFSAISGNHDVTGADFEELGFRELGQLCHDGYMDFLGPWEGKDQDYWLNEGSIRGYSAYSQLSTDNVKMVVGLVVHHWIQDAFGDSLVVYPDDMKKIFPNLQFIVAGHDHSFHESYVSRDGVRVVRPGSMLRTDSGKSSDRIPEIVVLDPASSLDSWSYHKIGCARPYSEVFYTEKKDVDKESAGAINAFVQRMNQDVGVILDVNSVVKTQFNLLPDIDKPVIKQDLVANGFMV
jgi:hypothetical protein